MFDKKKLIKVKKKYIKKGRCSDPGNCPIALAILEQMTDVHHVSVGDSDVLVYDNTFNGLGVLKKSSTARYKMPRSAYRFVRRFDAGKSVKPFNFYLTKMR